LGEPKYSIAGLEHGIVRCRHNIGSLKGAIRAERVTIEDYTKRIRDLKEAERLSQPIPVEVVHE
jgi:cell division protein FtsL